MKKCLLFLCILVCSIAYAGDGKEEPKMKLNAGNKVNSAIDNPSCYYRARSLKEQKHDSIACSKQKVQVAVLDRFAKLIRK